MRGPLAFLGAKALRGLALGGGIVLVLTRSALALPRLWTTELLRSLLQFGFRSLPLSLGVAVLTGSLVVVQTGLYVQRYGARLHLGWASGYGVIWEFGPLILGLTLAARVGARNAAELASLKLGGQLEGLRGISLDPFALLVAPRLLAIVLSMALLTPIVFAVAIAFEALAALFLLQLPLRVFLASMDSMLSLTDILGGASKSVAFAVAIALVSSAVGLGAQGGARAVGQAASRAMVHSCAAVFLLDFGLTTLFARLLR